MLFTSTLVTGTFIVISSSSLISAWVGLELNLLSFIPLMIQDFNKSSSDAALKYFLTQAFASIFFLSAALFLFSMNFYYIYGMISNTVLFSSLAMKMGAAPLHFWFPGVMQGISWTNCFILMTWQKLAPLFLITMVKTEVLTLFILTSALVGAIGGYNQMLTRKIMAYSSINHIGWMLSSTMISQKMLLFYFFIYSLMSFIIIMMFMKWGITHLSQILMMSTSKTPTLILATNLLSLGGIPPFLGFLPKWLIIYQMLSSLPLQTFILTMSSLITLYFYMRICYTLMLKSSLLFSTTKFTVGKLLINLTLVSMAGALVLAPLA
uniref:NADH-ubiquinone oxidoreductase chain 2 n=1 Tax=Lithobius maqinensis TaxID=2250572 RepID=A0A7L7S6W7_9MYRI|nr:NADH dehydrogenase subunit 2 [Lithobius forficatus]